MLSVSSVQLKKHLRSLNAYIRKNLESADVRNMMFCGSISLKEPLSDNFIPDFPGLDSRFINLEASFGDKVRDYCTLKKIRQNEVIDMTGIGRSTFYRILSGETLPKKDHCVEIALVLRLSYEEADDLLESAGYTFSRSDARDVALMYFFEKEIFDLTLINLLFEHKNFPLLGNVIE